MLGYNKNSDCLLHTYLPQRKPPTQMFLLSLLKKKFFYVFTEIQIPINLNSVLVSVFVFPLRCHQKTKI